MASCFCQSEKNFYVEIVFIEFEPGMWLYRFDNENDNSGICRGDQL